jgi:hypothetical protein
MKLLIRDYIWLGVVCNLLFFIACQQMLRIDEEQRYARNVIYFRQAMMEADKNWAADKSWREAQLVIRDDRISTLAEDLLTADGRLSNVEKVTWQMLEEWDRMKTFNAEVDAFLDRYNERLEVVNAQDD